MKIHHHSLGFSLLLIISSIFLAGCAVSGDSYLRRLESYADSLKRFNTSVSQSGGQASWADVKDMFERCEELDKYAAEVTHKGIPCPPDMRSRYHDIRNKIDGLVGQMSYKIQGRMTPSYPWPDEPAISAKSAP